MGFLLCDEPVSPGRYQGHQHPGNRHANSDRFERMFLFDLKDVSGKSSCIRAGAWKRDRNKEPQTQRPISFDMLMRLGMHLLQHPFNYV